MRTSPCTQHSGCPPSTRKKLRAPLPCCCIKYAKRKYNYRLSGNIPHGIMTGAAFSSLQNELIFLPCTRASFPATLLWDERANRQLNAKWTWRSLFSCAFLTWLNLYYTQIKGGVRAGKSTFFLYRKMGFIYIIRFPPFGWSLLKNLTGNSSRFITAAWIPIRTARGGRLSLCFP